MFGFYTVWGKKYSILSINHALFWLLFWLLTKASIKFVVLCCQQLKQIIILSFEKKREINKTWLFFNSPFAYIYYIMGNNTETFVIVPWQEIPIPKYTSFCRGDNSVTKTKYIKLFIYSLHQVNKAGAKKLVMYKILVSKFLVIYRVSKNKQPSVTLFVGLKVIFLNTL